MLRSVVAVECAATGDVLAALSWCKDIAPVDSHTGVTSPASSASAYGTRTAPAGQGGVSTAAPASAAAFPAPSPAARSSAMHARRGTDVPGSASASSPSPSPSDEEVTAVSNGARGLRAVATALTSYTVTHPEVFNVRTHTASAVAKSRARAHEHAERLLRQALCCCSDVELVSTLSLWQGSDLVTQVLAKSEIGEYGRLWEREGEDGSVWDADGVGSEGAVSLSSMLARWVHPKWFRETCMVLKTSKAMAQATRLVVAQQVRRSLNRCV
jgi:hypothetical protein